MSALLTRLVRYFCPPPIASVAELRESIAAESAYISQKIPIDYVEARAHAFSTQLFTEKPFLDALQICTRKSYAAVLGDLLILAEGMLRPAAGDAAPALADRLADFYQPMLATIEPPAHHPDGWGAAVEEFRSRYAFARESAPRTAADLGLHSGQRMFETLPLHKRFTQRDQDAIVATVQLRIGIFAAALKSRMRAETLIAELTRASSH